MLEKIEHNDHVLATIVWNSFRKDGIHFFTESDSSQQLGYMNRPKGYIIPPHVHKPVRREVHYTNEVLFIKSGKVRVDFYDEFKFYVQSRVLGEGDVLLLEYGGHGFEMIENTEIIEVKQGPYAGNLDKSRFVGITSDQAVFD